MRKKVREQRGHSLKTLFIFCVAVAVLVFGSLSLKALQVIKASRFDGSHQFTLAIFHPESKNTEVISFNPGGRTISVLQLTGEVPHDAVGKTLGIYLDGTITAKTDPTDSPGQKMLGLATTFSSARSNITVIDLVRLAVFANSVPGKDVSIESLRLPAGDTETDILSSQLFADTTFSGEDSDIEIINATGVPGMGSRLERILKNMGGRVLAVEAGRAVEKKTKLSYFGEKSYSVRRVERILGVEAEKAAVQAIADVQIVLGEDSLATKAF